MKTTRRCVICGTEISRAHYQRTPERTVCSRKCAGALPKLAGPNRKWKTTEFGGGRWKLGGYYALAKSTLTPDELALVPEDDLHYVLEHRLIMAKHIERRLETIEVVRHLNGIKTDNRIENLAIGSYQDNILDHVSLRRELALWKNIALTLLLIISEKNGQPHSN